MNKFKDLFKVRSDHISLSKQTSLILGTRAEGAPVIPVSAQFNYNIDVVCDSLVRKIPIPIKDFTSSPRMTSK